MVDWCADRAEIVPRSLAEPRPERSHIDVRLVGATRGRCSKPRNALITLIARSVEPMATRTEPIYGTRYGTVPLGREMKAWAASTAPAELGPPRPNPFLPTDFTIRGANAPKPRPEVVAPRLITSQPGLNVHFLQDATFARPKAFAFFLFRSPLLYTSPQVCLDLPSPHRISRHLLWRPWLVPT